MNIDILKNKITQDIKITKKKMYTNLFFSLFISLFIMLLNATIIGLAIWALVKLVNEIVLNKTSMHQIIMPTLVAIFTISLFIFSVLIIIYKVKSKVYYYQTVLNEYQFMIIKISEGAIDIQEAVDYINQLNIKKFEFKKLSTKKLLKKVLGG